MALFPALLYALTMLLGGRGEAEPVAFGPDLGEYETARVRLQDSLSWGEPNLAIEQARELLSRVQADESVPEWYLSEIEGLVDGFERVAALPTLERNGLLAALARDPAPADGPELAAQTHEHALELLREVMPPGHPTIARREYYLSNLALQRGQWTKCERLARESLATSILWRGEEGPETGLRSMWLGWVLYRLGRLEEAEEVLDETSRTFDSLEAEALGVYQHARMHVTNYRGVVAMDLGRLDEAHRYFSEYIRVAARLKGTQSATYLTALSNLSACLGSRQDPSGALAIMYECVAEAVRSLPPRDLSLVRFWYRLGTAAQTAGNLREALHAYERVIAATDGVGLRREISLLAKLHRAEICLLIGDEEGCVSAAILALEEIQNEGYVAPGLMDDVLGTVLYIFVRSRRFDRAAALLPLYEKVATGKEVGRAAVFRAFLVQAGGARAEALQAWRQCIRTLEPLGSSWLLAAYTEFGRLLLEDGDLEGAVEALQLATRHYELDRAQMLPGFGSTLARTSPYPLMARAEFQRGDANACFEALEVGSSRSLIELLERGGAPEGRAKAHASKELSDLEQQVSALRGAPDGSSESSVRLRELESQVLEMRRRANSLARRTDLKPSSVAKLQAGLAKDEAFIGWFDLAASGGSGALAWVLRGEGDPIIVPVGVTKPEPLGAESPTFSARLWEYRRQLHAEAASVFVPSAKSAHPMADRCGEMLFGELLRRRALDGVEHLFVCAPGLAGVPVEALRVEGMWVDECWTVSYAPSCSVHQRFRDVGATRLDRVLVIADPTFVATEPAGATGTTGDDDPWPSVAPKRRSDVPMPKLTASRIEAALVASAFTESTVLVGRGADERAMRRIASSDELQGYTAVHIATHSFVDDLDPTASYLALSQVDLPNPFRSAMDGGAVIDGYLTVPEILSQWRLDADLVTLSACRSALGANIRGEGHIGLTTAFLQAGAKSVVASHWNVQDEPTQLLMGELYGHLERAEGRHSKARALQRARRALRGLERGGQYPFAHPAFWSSFTLTGAP